ncbi:MAG: hypothetical protein ACOYXN_08835 [Acidobacteriota bacterium]
MKATCALLALALAGSAPAAAGPESPPMAPRAEALLGDAPVRSGALFRSPGGTLFLGEKGIYLYDPASGAARLLPLDPPQRDPAGAVLLGSDLCLVSGGSGAGSGYWRYDRSTGKGREVEIPAAARLAYHRQAFENDPYSAGRTYAAPDPSSVKIPWAGLVLHGGRLYLSALGSGLLEHDPKSGAFRWHFGGASRAGAGPQPYLRAQSAGGRLFFWTSKGPALLNPDTGRWALFVPGERLADPDWKSGFDAGGAAVFPTDLPLEDCDALLDVAGFCKAFLPLKDGVFFGNGLFLQGGVLRDRTPWHPAWLYDGEDGFSALTEAGTVWVAFNAECEEEARGWLLRTPEKGEAWEMAPLEPPKGRDGLWDVLDVTGDRVALLFRDDEPERAALVLLDARSLDWKPLGKSPCPGRKAPPGGIEEGDFLRLSFSKKVLWAKEPDL